jgi:hypothetical protein
MAQYSPFIRLDVPLVNVVDLRLPRPLDRRQRLAPADHAGLQAFPLHPLQSDAVLRIETLGLDHVPVSIRKMIKLAVGQDAVAVHKQ